MIRVLVALVGLMLVGSLVGWLVGCHAEADVDHPSGVTHVLPGR